MALVPNLRGAQAAIAAGVHKLTIPVSASQAHSMANVRKSREQMIEEVVQIVAYRNAHAPRVHIEANVATAFGCTIQGEVPEDEVVELACALVACGADETGLQTPRVMPTQHKFAGSFVAYDKLLAISSGQRTCITPADWG